MANISPLPTGRSSDLLVQSRLLAQLSSDQRALLILQNQVSTGRRISSPSEDAPAAFRAIRIQRLLEQKSQAKTNLTTSQSYLAASDSAISGVSLIMADIRGAAVAASDTSSSQLARDAISQTIRSALSQLLDVGNKNFRGRFLFAGAKTTVQPFSRAGEFVEYQGDEGVIRSFADVDLLFNSNIAGSDIFGAISPSVRGNADFQPNLTPQTRLRDLRGGQGISSGSFTLSDGAATSTVDISNAETIGDVARLLESSPPAGRQVTVRIEARGLVISLDDAGGGNLSISEIGAGATAAELGILSAGTIGTGPLVGQDLQPILRTTTQISDTLGVKASALVPSSGEANNLIVRALSRGAANNGVKVQFVDDSLLLASNGLGAGSETVSFGEPTLAPTAKLALSGVDNDIILTGVETGVRYNGVSIVLNASGNLGDAANAVYDPAAKLLTLNIDDSNETTIATLLGAINASGAFTAGPDPSAGESYDPAAVVQSADAGLVTGSTGASGKAPQSSRAALTLTGVGNDLAFTAVQPGDALNNVTIKLGVDASLGDSATAVYDATTKELTINIDDADLTSVGSLISAVEGTGLFYVAADGSAGDTFDVTAKVLTADSGTVVGDTGNSGGDLETVFVNIAAGLTTADNVVTALQADSAFSARFEVLLDAKDAPLGIASGTGLVDLNATGITADGAGADFDLASGIRIVNGGETFVIDFQGAQTVEDILNQLNGSAAKVIATINADATGIDVRSRLSGSDFFIGENGGQTATQLGIRSFDRNTLLSDLNQGLGVQAVEGVDFTIRRNDGVELDIDLSTAATVGDVLDLINLNPDNLNPATAVVARLKTVGNGIELVDDTPSGTGALRVTRSVRSQGAIDLGLIPPGASEVFASDAPPPQSAQATISLPPPNETNSAFRIVANDAGDALNGIQVVVANNAATGNQALVSFDYQAKTLTIDVDPSATTIATVVAAISAEGNFSAALETSQDPTNNGSTLLATTGVLATTSGGTPNGSAAPAQVSFSFPPPDSTNTAMLFTARQFGSTRNDVQVLFQDDASLVGDTAVANFDSALKTLTVRVNTGATTANAILQAVNTEGTFLGTLDRSADAGNNGSGLVQLTGLAGVTKGGAAEVLSGSDSNPLEAKGVFSALLRLDQALRKNDIVGIQRAAALIDDAMGQLSFFRAELGSQQNSLDLLNSRIDDEEIELQATLSEEIDVDLVDAISKLTARQASLEASFNLMGRLFRLNLLDFL